ncbi:MAG: YfhO family protein [Clostridia bacterium]|nr:YfhO family protein [Clostridia bacterium]
MQKKKQNVIRQLWHSDRVILALLYGFSAFLISFTAFRMLYIQHKLFAAVAVLIACIAGTFALFYLFIKKSGGVAKAADTVRSGKMIWLSLLLSGAVSVFVFAVYTLSPIGDYTVLRMDLYHQYGPLFAELYDKIAQGKSLLYSWNSAGGSGFLGNFFNYLSSPFTAMIFWFSKTEAVTTGISVIVFAKCIASAGTFAYYLKKKSTDMALSIPAFSLLYAFSAYFIAYFWNVMWLDAVVVFPLVMLGIERIIDRSNSKLYFVALIYTFLTSYYMAYMVCLFSVVYFVAYYLSNYSITALYVPKSYDMPRFSKLRQSRLLCAGLRFGAVSLLAALCCTATLLPIYKVLSASSATGDSFPGEVEFYFDIYDFIAAHLASLEPTIRSSGGDVTPNVYCGMITVLLYPLYLMSKRIGWKEKLVNTLLLIGIFICCNLNISNFVIHGFHFPNDLPYRFSFMYSFILLVCAYKVFRYIREFDNKTLVIIGGAFVLVVVIAQKFDLRYVNNLTIYFSIAFVIVYTLLLAASANKKLTTSLIGVVLCCAVVCEVLVCDVPRFEFGVQESEYVDDYEDYRKAISAISEEDDGFYRLELSHLPSVLRMAPCWYDYRGIDCFSSMASEANAKMQFRLGNASNKINCYTYNTQTPVYNMMFNIKYVIENNLPYKLNESYFEYLRGSQEKLTTYENKYPSSIGFAVNRALLKNWNVEGKNSDAGLQSEFMKYASGMDQTYFEKGKLFTNGAKGCSITTFENDGDGSISFSLYDDNENANFGLDFTAEKTGNYYIYLGSNEFDRAKIQTKNYTKMQDISNEPYLLDLGVLEKGEEVDITVYINDECEGGGDGTVYVTRLNDEAFQKAYNVLADDGLMQVEEYNDTYLKGTVTAKKDEILYTSITYDSGWKCYVDGVPVEPYKIGGCLIGLETGEGTHTVEFKYAPAGLKTGVLISAITLSAIALFFILKKIIIRLIARATDKLLEQNQQ